MATPKKRSVDFSNVSEGSGVNPKRVPSGDYEAIIVNVDETMKDEDVMWRFDFQLADNKTAIYPYYVKLVENQLWKLRNVLTAAGLQVPKKSVAVDPTRVLKKSVGITLVDDEYEGKLKSTIDGLFPANELAEADDEPEPVVAAKKPALAKKAATKATAPVEDDEDDDLDELDLDEL